MNQIDTGAIWAELDTVMDPEIPVVSLVEMGIIRDVCIAGSDVKVMMTPTFAGCPALHVMRQEVDRAIRGMGVKSVQIEICLAPPWSSDWISDEGRAKLKAFGLAPPPRHGGQTEMFFLDLARCPRCDGDDTSLKNRFGATQCRAIYYCNRCQEPFEQFKLL